MIILTTDKLSSIFVREKCRECERERERREKKKEAGYLARRRSASKLGRETFPPAFRAALTSFERQARGIAQSSIQKNEIFAAIPKRTAPTFSRARNYVKQYVREKKKGRNSERGRERERERTARHGIGILKNSKGPFPVFAPVVVSRATTRSRPLPLTPLTTEIDAGNAISSGSSAFILWCTFSVRPDDLSRANLRICINTIGVDSRGNSSGSRDSKLTEVCRQSYYLPSDTAARWNRYFDDCTPAPSTRLTERV